MVSRPVLFPLAYSLGYLEENERDWPAASPPLRRSSVLRITFLSLGNVILTTVIVGLESSSTENLLKDRCKSDKQL